MDEQVWDEEEIIVDLIEILVRRKESSHFSYRAHKPVAEYQIFHCGDYYRISNHFGYGSKMPARNIVDMTSGTLQISNKS